MTQRINPFHDLYLAERIGEDRFVKLFSPMFVRHALPLFQPGNVILKGLQGSGKTMLLNLLKPEIRLAYYKAKEEFPVPTEHSRFIGAGINLRKAGPIHFGQLLHQDSSHQDVLELVLFFADFVNYLIVDDLLQTIELFYDTKEVDFIRQIGLAKTRPDLDDFAKILARDECWFGALDGVIDYKTLRENLRTRIVTYRRYININLDEGIPSEVKKSKTTIGDPVLKTSGYLRQHGILAPDAQVLVRIDQYEQLPTFNVLGFDFGEKCQQIIHKALAARDPRVSYRIGTRHYAWPERPVIIGTNDTLEHKRDFSIINIDETLRRKENRRTWIFPDFAEDIFERRLTLAGIARPGEPKLLQKIVGIGLTPTERAEKYVKLSSRSAIIRTERDWPEAWVQFLDELVKNNPLSAKLGEAWCQQKGAGKKAVMYDVPKVEPYPWIEKIYWLKERVEQALIQIASRNRQQLIWGGYNDLLGLSGGNILVFLFLCQHIWDAWLRDKKSEKDDEEAALPEIDNDVQTTGIIEASEEWLRKQLEGADVKRRQEFVNRIGAYFYKMLTEDKSMSYPGRNGFSIRLDELEADQDVDKFLKIAVDYGDLYDAAHTSKTKGEKRKKYYLAPILSPAFKVPYTHTKEPEYLSGVDKVREWMRIQANPQQRSVVKEKKQAVSKTPHPAQKWLYPLKTKKDNAD